MNFASADAEGLTFDYLESYSALSKLMNKEEDRRDKRLEKFGYVSTDDLDIILMSFVRTSILDKGALLEEYEKYSGNVSRGKLEEKLHNAWQKYFHGTLRETDKEFCKALIEAIEAFIDLIPLGELDSSLSMLVELDRNDDAGDLFNLFLRKRPNFLEYIEPRDPIWKAGFQPLKEALDEVEHRAAVDCRSLEEIIDSAISGDFIERKDREALAKFSTEDLVHYFKGKDREHLTGIMRKLFTQTAQKQDNFDATIHDAVSGAAQIIGDMSRLNSLRMRNMGLLPKVEESEEQSD